MKYLIVICFVLSLMDLSNSQMCAAPTKLCGVTKKCCIGECTRFSDKFPIGVCGTMAKGVIEKLKGKVALPIAKLKGKLDVPIAKLKGKLDLAKAKVQNEKKPKEPSA